MFSPNLSTPDKPAPMNYPLIRRWTTSLHPLETPVDMEMHLGQEKNSGNISILHAVGKEGIH